MGGGGGGGGIPGGGGRGGGNGRGDYGGGNYGPGGDYKSREDGLNRQRSDRLEFDNNNGVDGFFPSPEGGNGHGSGAHTLHPVPMWRGAWVGVWSVMGMVSVAQWLLVNPF